MKVIKRYRTAAAAGRGLPILRIGMGQSALHIIGFRDLIDAKLTEISVITSDGAIAGNITMGHLDRLGNANHATPNPRWTSGKTAFPEERPMTHNPDAGPDVVQSSCHNDPPSTIAPNRTTTVSRRLDLTPAETIVLETLLEHAIVDTGSNTTARHCKAILAKCASARNHASATDGFPCQKDA